MKRFYVTTPIFYPNAQPHLGHAYATLLCDVLARSKRLSGHETYFLTGTDEHTEKVVKAANQQGLDPETYLETIVARFKALYESLDIHYDQFIRTSDKEVHWPGAIEMWNRLVAAGDLYKAKYTGLYCIGCESFITEKELVNGLCPDHGVPPEEISEENYFFRLSKYASELERLIESDELVITPSYRKLELLNFIRSGLQDVSFSRPSEKMTWGIPVPGDDAHTMYIWVDALTNYISALGFGRGEDLMDFWPGTHLVGKDILRFHAIFWPAMLLSAGLPLPKQIFVHGTIISGGQKMSKSIGNVIDPNALIERYGVSATRYLLLRHVHPMEDSDITREKLDEWYTANLVNGLGNVVARIMKMATTYLDEPVDLSGRKPKTDTQNYLDKFEFHNAVNAIWTHIGQLDVLINEQKPFEVAKHEPEKAALQLTYLVKELSRIASGLEPFMPETAFKIHEAIASNTKPENLFPRLG